MNTFRYQRKPTAIPYQNDYVFATRNLARRLIKDGCLACEDEDVWEHSDHRPVVARFELG